MHVIIGGCGRVGATLAERMSRDGHDVVLLDPVEQAFDRIGSAFNGEMHVADITDKDALVDAGIERADALVAVTALDNANLMAVQIATELFGLERTVARLFNPEREDSYRKMGVRYVSGTLLVAKAILNEIHAGAFPQHLAFADPDIEVVEMEVNERGDAMTVADLEARGAVRVAAIQRGARARVPRAQDRLSRGDIVVAAMQRGAHRKVRRYVTNPSHTTDWEQR